MEESPKIKVLSSREGEKEIRMIPERKNNPLRSYREQLFMTKAELARKAGISPLTVDRIERGMSCRLETKRKIILALGLELSEAGKIFGTDN